MIDWIRRRLKWTATGVRKAPRPFRYAVLEHSTGTRLFVKTYPKDVRLEFLRGLALFETATHTRLFRAPRPLELIESQNIIIWEYFEDLIETREYLLGKPPPAESIRFKLFFQIGRSLAAIHEGLQQVPTHGEFFPLRKVSSGNAALDRHVEEQISQCPRRPLHWDFCCGNLFVEASQANADPALVILDAMPNHYVLQKKGPDVVCPIYVDIAQMIFSLCCHPGFSPSISEVVEKYVDQFLAGYSEEAGFLLDRPTAFACSAELTQVYQEFRDKDQSRWSASARFDRRFRQSRTRRLIEAAMAALRAKASDPTINPSSPLAQAAG